MHEAQLAKQQDIQRLIYSYLARPAGCCVVCSYMHRMVTTSSRFLLISFIHKTKEDLDLESIMQHDRSIASSQYALYGHNIYILIFSINFNNDKRQYYHINEGCCTTQVFTHHWCLLPHSYIWLHYIYQTMDSQLLILCLHWRSRASHKQIYSSHTHIYF